MPIPQGKTPKKLTVDFTGIERGGGSTNPRLPEGDYLVQVVGATVRSKRDDPSKRHIAWETVIKKGNAKGLGKKFLHRTGLSQESLWSLRGLLIDMLGEDNVPQSSVDIPLARIVRDRPTVGFTIVDDEYNGKETSKVGATFPAADFQGVAAASEDDDDDEEDEDEEEEVPAPVKTKKAKKKVKPVVDDDDEDDDEDELDVDDL